MQKSNIDQLIRQLGLGLSIIGIFWLTLGVLPLTDNFILHSKHFGLIVLALVFVMLFASFSLARKRMELATTPLLTPLLIFGTVVLGSTLFTQPYPVEALLGLGGVYLASVLIAIFGGSLLPKNNENWLVSGVAVAGVVLTIFSISQLLGFGPSHLINTLFGTKLSHSLTFVLTGSTLIAFQLLITSLVGIGFLSYTTKRISKLHALLLPVLVIGIGFFGWSMLPTNQNPLVLPNPLASWSVVLDSLRSPRSAILGNGPESYINAYRNFKPLWINTQTNWGVDFTSASNTPLNLLSTMGLIGLLTWFFLLFRILKVYKSGERPSRTLSAMILFLLLIQFVLPGNVVIIGIIAFLLTGLIASNRDTHTSIEFKALTFHLHPSKNRVSLPHLHKEPAPIFMYFNLGLLLLMVGVLGYVTIRAYSAHIFAQQANLAAEINNGIDLYTLRQKAVIANPYLDSLRRDYAITNLLIASALANKADVTEQEKQQVSALLQQAVQEARAATVLDPADTLNWQVLARVYQNLIGIAEDAENWTVQAYVRAIETNPTNPVIRIALANVFMNQNQFDQAIGILQQAAQIKKDYPNTIYNLAIALQRKGDLDSAKKTFEAILQLLPEQSEDRLTVVKALEELEAEIAKRPATQEQQNETNQVTKQTSVPSITDQTINQPGQSPVSPEKTPLTLPSLDEEVTPNPTNDTQASSGAELNN